MFPPFTPVHCTNEDYDNKMFHVKQFANEGSMQFVRHCYRDVASLDFRIVSCETYLPIVVLVTIRNFHLRVLPFCV